MTDDLVKRLRDKADRKSPNLYKEMERIETEAADRIEALEKELFVRGCKNWDLFVEKSLRIESLEREKASWKGAYDGAVLAMNERIEELEKALREIISNNPIRGDAGSANIKDIVDAVIRSSTIARVALGEKKDG